MAAPNVIPFTIGTFLNSVRTLPGSPDHIRIFINGITVQNWEFQQWADPADTTDNSIVDVYLGLICNYINHHAGGILAPGVGTNYIGIPDVHYEPSRFYRGILDLPGAHILAAIDLQRSGIPTAIFRQIQYFFMPMAVQAHWSLVVISPVDETVEILDSTSSHHDNWQHRAENVYIKVFQFVQQMLGQHFVPNRWRVMDSESPQQGPRDTISCGYFVGRNAFRIACREPLDPQSYQNDYLWGERCRVGAEVIAGNFRAPHNTHPIHPHPGPANRNLNAPWQPLNQALLRTQARHPREPWTKSELTRRCRQLRITRGPRWVLGFSKWARSGQTATMMLRSMEAHFDKIYRGTFVP